MFPRAPENVTAAWLDGVLRDSGALRAGRLAAFESDVVGCGHMGAGGRYALTYHRDAQHDGGGNEMRQNSRSRVALPRTRRR